MQHLPGRLALHRQQQLPRHQQQRAERHGLARAEIAVGEHAPHPDIGGAGGAR